MQAETYTRLVGAIGDPLAAQLHYMFSVVDALQQATEAAIQEKLETARQFAADRDINAETQQAIGRQAFQWLIDANNDPRRNA